VKLEVSRLVKDYAERLGEHAKQNGNRLPKELRVNGQSPIEKVAMRITVDGFNAGMKQAKKSA
jgi:hypothetical protein